MKTLVSNLPGPQPNYNERRQEQQQEQQQEQDQGLPMQESYAPPPESVAGDLEAERRVTELEFESFSGSATIMPLKEEDEGLVVNNVIPDDLQPGGLAVPAEPKKQSPENDNAIESPLSSMSIKELRRMAEANGIPGSADLRKRELIRALRDKVNVIINNDQPTVMSFDEVDAPGSE